MLRGQRVVELGAGMMPYGYALAAVCQAKNFVAVEPYYSDLQEVSIQSFVKENWGIVPRIPFKVSREDMLAYLMNEPMIFFASLLVESKTVSCLEPITRRRSNGRSSARSGQILFVSSHSDLCPQSLDSMLLS